MLQPHIIPITDRHYRLAENYTYTWLLVKSGTGMRIVVPKNFIYDGASVPGALGWMVGLHRDGLIRAAALVHDFIYKNKGSLPYGSFHISNNGGVDWEIAYGKWSRADCDRLFHKMMVESGMSGYKVDTAYNMVKMFGWTYWKY